MQLFTHIKKIARLKIKLLITIVFVALSTLWSAFGVIVVNKYSPILCLELQLLKLQ